MSPEEKNAPTIKELEKEAESLGATLNYLRDNHNSRYSSLAVTHLEIALHFIEDRIKELKQN